MNALTKNKIENAERHLSAMECRRDRNPTMQACHDVNDAQAMLSLWCAIEHVNSYAETQAHAKLAYFHAVEGYYEAAWQHVRAALQAIR